MPTTALVIEILVGGVVSVVWLAMIIFALPGVSLSQLQVYFEQVKDIMPVIAFGSVGFMYFWGWILHLVTEATIDRWQVKFRDKLYKSNDTNFFEARNYLFIFGSNSIIADIEFDRHILRIMKTGILNFIMIALCSLLHLKQNPAVFITLIVATLAISIFLIFQWKKRFISTYKKIQGSYELYLRNKDGEVKKNQTPGTAELKVPVEKKPGNDSHDNT